MRPVNIGATSSSRRQGPARGLQSCGSGETASRHSLVIVVGVVGPAYEYLTLCAFADPLACTVARRN